MFDLDIRDDYIGVGLGTCNRHFTANQAYTSLDVKRAVESLHTHGYIYAIDNDLYKPMEHRFDNGTRW
jgi:hypothetical protein